jgi:hypothetical protein
MAVSVFPRWTGTFGDAHALPTLSPPSCVLWSFGMESFVTFCGIRQRGSNNSCSPLFSFNSAKERVQHSEHCLNSLSALNRPLPHRSSWPTRLGGPRRNEWTIDFAYSQDCFLESFKNFRVTLVDTHSAMARRVQACVALSVKEACGPSQFFTPGVHGGDLRSVGYLHSTISRGR